MENKKLTYIKIYNYVKIEDLPELTQTYYKDKIKNGINCIECLCAKDNKWYSADKFSKESGPLGITLNSIRIHNYRGGRPKLQFPCIEIYNYIKVEDLPIEHQQYYKNIIRNGDGHIELKNKKDNKWYPADRYVKCKGEKLGIELNNIKIHEEDISHIEFSILDYKQYFEIPVLILKYYPNIQQIDGQIKIKCQTCGQLKDPIEFHKDPSYKIGIASTCIGCVHSKYHNKTPEEKTLHNQKCLEWVNKNRERAHQSWKKWYEEHKEEQLAYYKQWGIDNKDKIIKEKQNILLEELKRLPEFEYDKIEDIRCAYIFEYSDKIKIGVSYYPQQRLKEMDFYLNEGGKINAIMFFINQSDCYKIEYYLHNNFIDYNIEFNKQFDGCTEFFKKECLNDVLKEIKQFNNYLIYE